MNNSNNDIVFMREAIKEAALAANDGNIPVGAVIVRDGKIIAKGRNCRFSNKDPIGHAEIIAIKKASEWIGDWRCTNTTLYVTLEPCLMCVGAIINSRITRLVYGSKDERFGALTLYNIHENNLTNHKFDVTSGILEKECKELLQIFFSKLRKDK